jgi:hypothetical protein
MSLDAPMPCRRRAAVVTKGKPEGSPREAWGRPPSSSRHHERTHAVLAHVAERHRLAGGGSWSLAHGRYVAASAARGLSPVLVSLGRADPGRRIPLGSPAACWASETTRDFRPRTYRGISHPASGRAPGRRLSSEPPTLMARCDWKGLNGCFRAAEAIGHFSWDLSSEVAPRQRRR